MTARADRIVSEASLRAALNRVLGTADADLRPEQRAIVEDIVRGRDVLAVLPTGSGKSVCYEVPALCLPGVTLVISPLVSLIQEQGETLFRRGVPVACLAGGFLLDADGPHIYVGGGEEGPVRARRDRIYDGAASGRYKLLYVTPERLRTGAFLRFAQHARISLAAVDEAHCVSLWGYEFRPQYLEISRLFRRMDSRPAVAAFTATASAPVRADIRRFLAMRAPREHLSDPLRENLRFSVRRFETAEGKMRFLLRYLRAHPDSAGFVYCASTASVDAVYGRLCAENIPAVRYYAELDRGGSGALPLGAGESKRRNLEAFLGGERRVMVSTTALGMGIDRRDVRFVLHYEMPLCLENYVQEAGRAGRDGAPADCVLCAMASDEAICRALIEKTLGESRLSGRALETRRAVALGRLKSVREYGAWGAGKSAEALQAHILAYLSAQDEEDPALREIQLAAAERVTGIDALYANRTKVAGELRKGRTEGNGLSVGARGRGGPTVSFRLEGPPLRYFDMMVADAVYTLMKNRVSTVTARQIMALLSGDAKLTLRPERKREVEESLRKMTAARITIDRRGSMRYGFVYSDEDDPEVISGPFLPLTEKRTGFGYDSKILPPLYAYAEILNGQFFTLPLDRLRVEGLPTSAENLSMAFYLFLRVGTMRRGPRKDRAETSRTVRFDTMLRALGVALPEEAYYRRRKTAALLEKERRILEHFRDTGYIRGFALDETTCAARIETAALHEEET